MRNTVESRLRIVALALTLILLLQVVWSGTRLLFLSDPEPIAPAASALTIEAPGYRADLDAGATPELVARPLFWPGRQPFVPAVASEPEPEPEPEPEVDDSAIEGLKLLGVYAAGSSSGIIVSSGNERRRLRLNESLDGWKFTMLGADGATFEKGAELRILRLEHALPAAAKTGEDRGRERAARPATNKSNNGGD